MTPLRVFVSYAHKDRKVLEKLNRHLAVLRREGSLAVWSDGEIDAGGHFNREIGAQIDAADVFLCLVTEDFLGSEYSIGVEFKRALERHRGGAMIIVPVIVKPCLWKRVFGDVEALPRDGVAISDRKWGTSDRAFSDVAEGLAKLVESRTGKPIFGSPPVPAAATSSALNPVAPSVPPVPVAQLSDRSKYARYRISQIFKEQMRNRGLNIDNLDLDHGIHVQDIEVLCQRLYFTDKPPEMIRTAIDESRGIAFATKYADPTEDEKLLDPREIKLEGLRHWEEYLGVVLRALGLSPLLEGVDLLDVGAGNGWAVRSLYGKAGRVRAVDLSDPALGRFGAAHAKSVERYTVAAERLDGIESSSVQLYLSFRTYQSTLFHRRGAIQEAFRVIEYGGAIVLSVPTMYLDEERQVLRGLIPPRSKTPDEAYARWIVGDIRDSLVALNFRDVKVDDTSPFETYIYARRP